MSHFTRLEHVEKAGHEVFMDKKAARTGVERRLEQWWKDRADALKAAGDMKQSKAAEKSAEHYARLANLVTSKRSDSAKLKAVKLEVIEPY